jgi:flagellar basal body rod protein FlgG
MTEMMQASRTFEAFQKVLDQFGEMDRKLLTTVPSAVE